ncbi:sugar phosphorylase [Glaciecola sp. 1036]|uniref:sugar phosphorylase n=1 Tax=Alteromonadaceae TaxID=72275 RepID=UPI003D046287
MQEEFDNLVDKIVRHLEFIYAEVELEKDYLTVAKELLDAMRLTPVNMQTPTPHSNLWDEKDVVLITYGDSVYEPAPELVEAPLRPPLKTLSSFLHKYCINAISHVHVLPFFPYSSDDGFSVIDYSTVNQGLGDWSHIESISSDFGLMADLVINHCSSRSAWFQQFINDQPPGNKYFYTASPDEDLSMVTRPRTSPLLRETKTPDDVKHVWCTFSHDQVDFDFSNPDVLVAFAKIIRLYMDKGTKIFRFDAIAFLWKKLNTSCINLPETHEAVRLLRTLIEYADNKVLIITETNIPNRENLTYFGNANEAHGIYNFSLPPLLVNTLLTGNCTYLKNWMMSMPPAQNGTFYFNFIASHDGIGLRPAEGLLDESEIRQLTDCVLDFGGKISWRTLPDGTQKPYEMNIALIDALKGTIHGEDEWQLERFICAHAIMFGLEGIPGLYIHSLLGTTNDYERVSNTGQNRGINRHRWEYPLLKSALDNVNTIHHRVLTKLTQLLHLRRAQRAFHPNAIQFTLQLGEKVFGYWRQSLDRKQSIFCISNITTEEIAINLSDINLIGTDDWIDLITQETVSVDQVCLNLQPYQTMWISNVFEKKSA